MGKLTFSKTNQEFNINNFQDEIIITGTIGNQVLTIKLLDINNPEEALTANTDITLSDTNNGNAFKNIDEVEVINAGILTIISEVPLSNLIIKNSTVILCNSYIGAIKTNINIGNYSKLVQKDKDLPTESVTLGKKAQIEYTLNNRSYDLINNSDNDIKINNLHNITKIKNLLWESFLTPWFLKCNAPDFAPNIIKPLKLYEINKEALKLFLSKVTDRIDSYIAKNYFLLTGIVKSLAGSNLPEEIMIKITSYLKLSDVVIKPQDKSSLMETKLNSNDGDEVHSKITGDSADLHLDGLI